MGIINTAGQLLLNCVFTQIASALGFIVFAIASACRYAGFTASGRLSAVSVLPPKQQLTNIYIYIYIYMLTVAGRNGTATDFHTPNSMNHNR
jgi:hypothetical protein